MRSLILLAVSVFAMAGTAAAEQPIDCSTPIARAQQSIDKITGDLQGMDTMMAKEELSQVHALVSEAESLQKQARHDCAKSATPYAQARGIARADAADGYATAADILHFHYMQPVSGGMKQTPMGEATAKPKSGTAGMHNMNGMPSKQ
jgi:hypothetical protein